MRSAWWDGDWPVTQEYGCTDFLAEGASWRHPECPAFHDGIDLGMACGTRLFSQANGYVYQRGVYGGGPNALIIDDGRWFYWLFHMERAYVDRGDKVVVGQHIADSDNMGFSTGCHLHFEVTASGGGYRDSVDPVPFLRPFLVRLGVQWPWRSRSDWSSSVHMGHREWERA